MKKIVIYIILGLCVCLASNVLYVYGGLYDKDIRKCSAELVYTMDSSLYKNKTLYFGESSNFTFSKSDSIKKSISELVNEQDPGYSMATLSKGAIHAGTYNALIQRIPENTSVKAVILTLNLRSFGINWIESKLETNLSRANIIYANYPSLLKKFCLSFKIYDNKEEFKRKEAMNRHYSKDKFRLKTLSFTSVRDWDKYTFNKGIADSSGKKDPALTQTACHFIKNYAFIINENNPRIKDLDRIVTFCKSRNIQLIYHLLPENYQRAKALCSSDLVELMEQNVTFLKGRYQDDVIFIDNLKLLSDSCFIDRDWPTEHYMYYGRKRVANSIHEKLKAVYSR